MTRTLGLRMILPVISTSLLLTGCGDAGMEFAENFGGTEAPGVKQYPYQAQFEAASKKFNVPVPILVAIGYSETRLYHVPGEESDIEGLPPTYGVMALRGDAISKGAELAGVPETDVQADPGANIMAAAALLDQHATTLDVDRDDLGAWAPAIAALFDNPNLEASSHFIHEEVYRVLREGITAPEDSGMGEILKAVRHVTANFPFLHVTLRGGELPRAFYSGAIWRPAPAANYTSGRRGHDVELLVVHTCAGSYTSCWGWLTSLKNPSRTSAHYVVNETGSEVSALVDEMDTAHHVGKSWQGLPTNPRSIGIEHGGFSYSLANPWTEGQLAASANLACDVVKRHNLVRDRNHILGHYQPDPVNRPNDPGIDFPWAVYMSRITECLGESGGDKDGDKRGVR
ncbi:MAG: N-acetylmuramoyl-L-alanine amidase [Polyangiaceae bacterium]|nr:N-acetylmuramoyl-L-alanine amidase [Polyangiaceae bacterium]